MIGLIKVDEGELRGVFFWGVVSRGTHDQRGSFLSLLRLSLGAGIFPSIAGLEIRESGLATRTKLRS